MYTYEQYRLCHLGCSTQFCAKDHLFEISAVICCPKSAKYIYTYVILSATEEEKGMRSETHRTLQTE